ncbi:glycoside hydrolase family 6 protein [Cellulomonas sp. NPDC089187]|uniref:glycoside hydrolase family 6 protein n=1 Tax=Cellulomonas sp. NPDC089187 TaxID=3154970 RepID=UPI003435AE54
MTRRATLLLGGALVAVVAVVVLVIALVGRGNDPVAAPEPTPTPSATAASCAAELTVTSTWPGGFGADLVVTTGVPAPDWRLSWTLSDDATATEGWGGTLVADGSDGLPVQMSAPEWDVDLAAGQSATVGFNGATTAQTEPTLTGVSLNGQDCDLDGVAPAIQPVDEGDDDTRTTDFYVDPNSQAAHAAADTTGELGAAARRIASTPQALWVTDTDPQAAAAQVATYTAAAADAGQTGLLAIYGIPGRDCGAHSAGGATEQTYLDWVGQIAAAIHGEPWVILEPDALPQLGDCDGQGDRVGMLRGAAELLDQAGARVYLDAGHSRWLDTDEAVRRIELVGTAHLAGFSLNVSNYRSTVESVQFGEIVSQALGDLGYVIDTSRNGVEPTGTEWCNVRGAALGEDPHLVNDDTTLDAVLWIKRPGESDGTCNGGPAAGQWWPEIAQELVTGAEQGQ